MRGIFSDPEMQGYYTTDLKVINRKAAKEDPKKSQSPPPRYAGGDDDYTIFMKYVNFPKVREIYRRYAKNISAEDNRFNARSRDIILRRCDA